VADGSNKISCQLSLYPLGEKKYIDIIKKILVYLKEIEGLEVTVNSMSTVIYGDEDLVWRSIRGLYSEADKSGEFSMILTLSNVCGSK
jgi:uncharacterized protein YqgV (UPF0045/DUF77 family)